MTQRARLLHTMHQSGLRLDDAATAADVAIRSLREQRDAVILAAREVGLSYRQIATICRIDVARVHRICRVLTRTPTQSTPVPSIV